MGLGSAASLGWLGKEGREGGGWMGMKIIREMEGLGK